MRLLALAGLALALSVGDAHAAEAAPAPAPSASTPIHLGVHVISVRGLDMRSQSFFADLYLWLRFATSDAVRAKTIVEKFEVMNGRFDVKEEVERKEIGDQTYLCFRLAGTFNFNATLHRYPFDVQDLELIFENSALETDTIHFVDDVESYRRSKQPEHLWGVKSALDIPEFRLVRVLRRAVEEPYPTDFGDPTRVQAETRYSRFIVTMQFQREYLSYLFKIVIPLLVIIAMTYLMFFLPPKEICTSSTIAITALLSCIAFNIAVAENMPEVGYLVVSDKFFIASYLLLLAALAESIFAYAWDDAGKTERALRVTVVSRYVFPIAVGVVFAYLMIGGLS